MTQAEPRTDAVQPTASGGGFLANLFGLYFTPKEAFQRIVASPALWAPLLLFTALQLGFTGVWLSKLDMIEFMRTQAEAQGQQAPPPEAMGIVKVLIWAPAVLAGPISMVVGGALYLFIFRFFLASEVTFKQSMSILIHTFAATGLVTFPLMLLVFSLKGDWNLNPQELLQANPTAFLEKDAVAKPLWALLSSLDVFSFWVMFLLAVGFGVASKRATGSAFWGAATPWIVYVVGKVLFAFL